MTRIAENSFCRIRTPGKRLGVSGDGRRSHEFPCACAWGSDLLPESVTVSHTSGERSMRDAMAKRKTLTPPVVTGIGFVAGVLCLILVSFCCPQQICSGSDFINNCAEHRWILALRDGSLGFFYQHNVGQWFFSSSYFEDHLNFPRGQLPNADIGLPHFAGAVLPLWLPLLVSILTIILQVRRSRKNAAGGCPMCGYDLTGNTTGRCPECGATISADHAFSSTL